MTGLTYDISMAAEVLADDETVKSAKSTAAMGFQDRANGIAQMLIDLKQLAEDDGCAAAAWAYEYFLHKTLGR